MPSKNARELASATEQKLRDLAATCRAEIELTGDGRAEVLLETTAEALLGLAAAHAHFAKGAEEAMREE